MRAQAGPAVREQGRPAGGQGAPRPRGSVDRDGLFEATAPFLFFDYLRVPYSVAPGEQVAGVLQRLAPLGRGPAAPVLLWPAEEGLAARRVVAGAVDRIPVFARMMGDGDLRAALDEDGRAWSPAMSIRAGDRPVGTLWRASDGSIALPFDPGEAIETYWSERYLEVHDATLARAVFGAARRAYYRLRPIMSRRAQLAARRAFSRVQGRRTFPAWPVEAALHDFYGWLYRLLSELAVEPIPWLRPWPAGYRWAFLVTHDVETQAGVDNLEPVRGIDRATGFPSSWNFVPERYAVDRALVRRLWDDGFEVGVHGLRHDGRDLESAATLTERLPAIRSHAKAWDARGFRSPATQRAWELMPMLGFDYDTSYTDSDPYEPQPGGCLSWWPYPIGDTVELPLTLPQDHTLFVILGQSDERLWVEKAAAIRDREGMALLLAHPDYMLQPGELDRYRRFLEGIAADTGAWRPRPFEVAGWWRRRATSVPLRRGDGWVVDGPATEADVSVEAPR